MSLRDFTLRDFFLQSSRFKHPLALPNVIGDALLLRQNALFRWTRESALSLGFKFVDREKMDHRLPTFCLLAYTQSTRNIAVISSNKRVASTIKWSKGEIPILKFLNSNYPEILNNSYHDSAHAILFDLLKDFSHEKSLRSRHGEKFDFFFQILGESLANTVEFCGYFLNQPGLEEISYSVNSAISFLGEEAKKVKKICASEAVELLLPATFWCFVYHHYIYRFITDHEAEVILTLSGCERVTQKNIRWIHQLFKAVAFNRGNVTNLESFYLHFAGFEKSLHELASDSFAPYLEFYPDILRRLRFMFSHMSGAVSRG
jgi:hypothetical protein